MRLDKSKSRERWSQLRALWNEWDPIGVADAVQDEYDSYLGPTLRLLESHASVAQLEHYLADVTLGHMGLSDVPEGASLRHKFVLQLNTWYEANWPDSSV
jgi:hypothetical protein